MGVDEILVHISGPSSTKDDQMFRAMAAAYDRFEPAISLSLTTEISSLSQQAAQPRSPSVSFSSQRVLSSSDGSISVAVPRTDEALIKAATVDNQAATIVKSLEYIEDTPLAVAALESQLLTSSLAVSPLVSSPLAQRASLHQEPLSDNTTQSESFHTPLSAANTSLHENSAQSELYQPQALQDSPLSSQNAAAPAHPMPGKHSAPFASLPDTIFPPTPPTSNLPPDTSQITPRLHQLAETLNLAERFKPLSTSRPLRPLERGYWRIDSSMWARQVQLDFWSFLVEFLGSGSAGWSVSAYRESTGADETSDEDVENIDPTGERVEYGSGLGMVRIYCWGEVVGHIYLVAFVASWSKVRLSKAQWIDAEGEVVVQMP